MGNLNPSVELQDRADSAPADSESSLLAGNSVLHHLGYAVANIAAVGKGFAESMSARWNGEIIHDPLQRVRVAFFTPMDARNPVFELVEPASDKSPVSSFLKKRVGLHHVCYETDDLESRLRAARRVGAVIVGQPTPAVAFGGRRIAWVCTKGFLLMEFLERSQK